MKNEKYEFVQRIKNVYVGQDCIQIMVPHIGDTITILNADGMTYHSMPNSPLFVNKYVSDDRKGQFPYSNIPIHKSRVKGKKVEFINQLFDFGKVYIEIADGVIKESYAMKDDEEALLVTKYLVPKQESSEILTRAEIEDLYKKVNGEIYGMDGTKFLDNTFSSDDKILEWYRERIIKARNDEIGYHGYGISNDLTDMISKNISRMTVHDVPSGICVFSDRILVFVENGEIKSIKGISGFFEGPNRYKVETYDFPITIYSLEHLKQIEQTSFRKTPEPKFKFFNSDIDKDEIKKSKIKVLDSIKRNKS